MDETLHRLYAPILWRSLNAANPSGNQSIVLTSPSLHSVLLGCRTLTVFVSTVRKNALAVFIDAFPLQKEEGTRADLDALLQRQFDFLQTLLMDKDVGVRTLAVQGVSALPRVWCCISDARLPGCSLIRCRLCRFAECWIRTGS